MRHGVRAVLPIRITAIMTAVCGARGCSKPSTSQCPKCIELQLPAVYFCSQTCFATIWSEHKLVHREAVEVRKARVYQPPGIVPPGIQINACVSQ